jgi:murein DD-endopeptidase MepM/ murein hydrolase activator NlpD
METGMKRLGRISFLIQAVSLLLAACGRPATPTPLHPSPVPALPSPARTSTSTSTPLPSLTPTATPIPCDLLTTDFCIGAGDFIFQPPIAPPGNDTVDRSYPYGSTEDGTREVHHGVEFENAFGTPVLAAADGTVTYAGNETARKFSPWAVFYGNIVVIEHRLTGASFSKLYSFYAHLSKIDVSTGQTVRAGETIGEVGMSGTASGSHLHFEVRINPDDYTSTLNPELWLLPHPGSGTLAILVTDQTGASVFPSFAVQYFQDRHKPATATWQVVAYASETVNPRNPWNEVAAIGDQPAGWYRITFFRNYTFYERWVEIQPGMLTRAAFVVK